MQLVAKSGTAEVVLSDDSTASGRYQVVFERSGPIARGIVRLDEGQPSGDAGVKRQARIRFDGATELEVDVYLCVPEARVIAFTCSEATELARRRRP
jgi:hypothetical protein